jgi:beta-lactamase class A
MRSLLLSIILICLYGQQVAAQQIDRKLQNQLESLVKGFHGDIGVYVKDLRKNRIAAINADTVFPTASIVKVPILIGLMDKMNRGELNYQQQLIYKDSLNSLEGADILSSFKSGEKIELGRVMMLMLSLSDNTASIWLQSLAGGGARINYILDSIGFKQTRVNSRTPGREAIRKIYGWGQTTPREISTLMDMIGKGQVISRGASDKMLRVLNRTFFDIVSVSQIPPYATIYAKYGALDENRNELIMVRGRKSNYVFCVMTKNNADHTWKDNNEAWVLTRKISSLLWHHFNPKDHWQPAADAAKFQ